MIALDDFDPDAPSASLLHLADFVKIDFIATPEPQRESLAKTLLAQGKLLIAEKVETSED